MIPFSQFFTRGFIFVFAFIAMSFSQRAQAKSCTNFFIFSEHRLLNETKIATEGLIAYLDLLLEKGVIRERELDRLIDSLKEGEFINPIDEARAEFNSELYEHFKGLDEYLERRDLDLGEILQWALIKEKENKKERWERSEVRRETEETYQDFEFNLVPPGRFKMGRKGNQVDVTLTHAIEVMSTPVTQKMWVELMGKNPSYHATGLEATVIHVDGEEVSLQPDHPVENITWWSVLVFANRLSELHGLKPVYDLSGVSWEADTNAKEGSLIGEEGEIKINSKTGNYYEAEGYRLPTDAEQEYLLRLASISKGREHFETEEELLQGYAWFKENSQGVTQPVAGLKPLLVNEGAFYDLFGNVYEWGWDKLEEDTVSYDDALVLVDLGRYQGGENPEGINEGDYRVFRSGWYGDLAEEIEPVIRRAYYPFYRYKSIGFRLVRTLDVGGSK